MKRLSLRLNGATVVAVATLGLAFAMCSFANGPNIIDSASVANVGPIEAGPWCGELTTAEAFDVVVEIPAAFTSVAQNSANYVYAASIARVASTTHSIVVNGANRINRLTFNSEGGPFEFIFPTETAIFVHRGTTDAQCAVLNPAITASSIEYTYTLATSAEGVVDAILHGASPPWSVAMTMSSA